MRGEPHPRLVDEPAISFQLGDDFINAAHFSIPSVALRILIGLETQVAEKPGSNPCIEMSRILLPPELIAVFFAIFRWRAADRFVNLLEREHVVANVR
jgi:hypothetical protein